MSRHFGPLSPLTFSTSRIPMLLLVFVAGWQALRRERHGAWLVLTTAAGVQFGLNAVFHLAAAIALREYSPGMLTGACLGLPGSLLLLRWVHRGQRLTSRELAVACALGAALAAAAIGVLFLH